MALDGMKLHAVGTPANAQYSSRKIGKNGTAIPSRLGRPRWPQPCYRCPGTWNPEPSMLFTADRYSYQLITAITVAGADFCIRVSAKLACSSWNGCPTTPTAATSPTPTSGTSPR